MNIEPIQDIDNIKTLSSLIQDAPKCQLEIHEEQLTELFERHKNDLIFKICGGNKMYLPVKYLENFKYCDIRMRITRTDEPPIETRLKWNPVFDNNEKHPYGVLVVYNPSITHAVGKFPQIGIPICCGATASKKCPKTIMPTRNIFIPWQDALVQKRFASEQNVKRIHDNTADIWKYVVDIMYIMWAPILVDGMESFKKLPDYPKKPATYICNNKWDELSEIKSFLFERCFKHMFPNVEISTSNISDVMIKMLKMDSEQVLMFDKTVSDIIGEKSMIDAAENGENLLDLLSPDSRRCVSEIIGSDTLFIPPTNTQPTQPKDEVIEEPTPTATPKPLKEYSDDLDGFIDMMNDEI